MSRFSKPCRAACAGVLGLALLGAGAARAQDEAVPAHRFSVYCGVSGGIHLSDARTAGGVGGGCGVRDTVRDRFLLQADLNYLTMVGNSLLLRVGAGIQRRGLYSPAALVVLSGFLGGQLTFITPEHPTPAVGPGLSVGVALAPLRFNVDGLQISLVELGVGLGSEWPGQATAVRLGLFEVGASF
ncbi:hypothetical protein JRI60_39825 [Archangium violaceum]|uniref:hypothetical protein n=1 Tax=Archangium violaceum TaxID=83451 RepID=UPI00194ED82F|nr:hypothetical protein [Archangium violaceum]QRN95173.1 hypothetical protein JRI60_39825 [Archangium violaceum]